MSDFDAELDDVSKTIAAKIEVGVYEASQPSATADRVRTVLEQAIYKLFLERWADQLPVEVAIGTNADEDEPHPWRLCVGLKGDLARTEAELALTEEVYEDLRQRVEDELPEDELHDVPFTYKQLAGR
ncbi:MAG: hypothetical protein ABEL76_03215 [Bradymonadaceae bacterium]